MTRKVSNLRLLTYTRKTNKADIEYCQAINELIPEASRYANEQAGLRPATLDPMDPRYMHWCNKWNFHFHSQMDTLAKKYELRTQAYQKAFKQ